MVTSSVLVIGHSVLVIGHLISISILTNRYLAHCALKLLNDLLDMHSREMEEAGLRSVTLLSSFGSLAGFGRHFSGGRPGTWGGELKSCRFLL